MLKYKIVTSVALALLVAGCGANNDNDNGTTKCWIKHEYYANS